MKINVTPRLCAPTTTTLQFRAKDEIETGGPIDQFRPTEATPPPAEPEPAQPGDKREFWTWDMSVMPPGTKRITSTCRAVGDNTNIWVDDAVWDRLVTEDDVILLQRRMEKQSPTGSTDPRKGVAEINHDYFGKAPRGLDGDSKVNVLLTEFASFRGTVMDGYFNAFDTMTDESAQAEYDQRSNESNVIYLNAAARRISSDYMQGVLAHEHHHLLHFPHDPDEESWLGEMLGEVAMKVNGYHTDMGHVARHQTRPDRPLVSQTYVDYGACMLFGSYLTEQFGHGFIEHLTKNPDNGIASINSSLTDLGQETDFQKLYANWTVANYADARGVISPGLHYGTLDVPAPAETALESTDFSDKQTLKPSGVKYHKLPKTALSLELSSQTEGFEAEILEFEGKKLTRKPFQNGGVLEGHPDRVVVVRSLAAEEAEFELIGRKHET